MARKVLISGAGIAGCCLAWWLNRYGYDVTLVEQAPAPRKGGYVIDFWGLGYEVAERMGVVEALKAQDLDIEQMRIVNHRGLRIGGFDQASLRKLSGGRIMSLPRSVLALSLYEAVKDRVTTRFGDSVRHILQDDGGVGVDFEGGDAGRYDLVFGADGLHSSVRALAFGADAKYERFLGYYAAAFTVKDYPHRDPHAYVMYGRPGRQIARITLKSNASVFLLLLSCRWAPGPVPKDITGQKALLRQVFSGAGWESKEIIGALESSTDLYFDRMSQIEMPTWHNGRVALIGDACACPSLLAGEGSSMAMAEAYTLAGELHTHGEDYARAFDAYERHLQPFANRKQKAARGFASSFVPKTSFGLWLRNTSLSVINGLGLSEWAFRGQLNDPFTLPEY